MTAIGNREIKMKKSKLSESQIVTLLKEDEGIELEELVRQHGFSKAFIQVNTFAKSELKK